MLKALNTRKRQNEDLDHVQSRGNIEADHDREKDPGHVKRSQDPDRSPPKALKVLNIRKSQNENRVLALNKEAGRSLDQNPAAGPVPVQSQKVEKNPEVKPDHIQSKEAEGKADPGLEAETDLDQNKEVEGNQDREVRQGLDQEEGQDHVLRGTQGDVKDRGLGPERNHPRDPKVEILNQIFLVINFHCCCNTTLLQFTFTH